MDFICADCRIVARGMVEGGEGLMGGVYLHEVQYSLSGDRHGWCGGKMSMLLEDVVDESPLIARPDRDINWI